MNAARKPPPEHRSPASLPAVREHDAVIVGAGPAGALAALRLARFGHDVLLVDRARFPRTKVCGGCLNVRALAALETADLGHIARLLHGRALHGFRLQTPRRKLYIPLPGGIAVSRQELDFALVQAAQQAGAQFAEAITAIAYGREHNGWSVTLSNGRDQSEVSARAILIASGLGAKPLNGAGSAGKLTVNKKSRLGAGIVLEGAAQGIDPGVIQMVLGSGGYVGLVQLERDRLGVAAALDPEFVRGEGGLAPAVAGILSTAGQPIPNGLIDAPWRGTPLLTRRLRPVAGWRFLVAGDASGYVEPFTGEGMAWAMTAGLRAATFIDAGLAQRHWPETTATAWTSWHRRHIGWPQLRCRPIASALRYGPLIDTAMLALRVMPSLAQPFIASSNRPDNSIMES